MEEDDVDVALLSNLNSDREKTEGTCCFRCDPKKCFDVNQETRRPSSRLILLVIIVFVIAGLLTLPLGIIGVYKTHHEIITTLNVTGYSVQKLKCNVEYQVEAWTTFIKAEYRIRSGAVYKDESYYVCGNYYETSLEHAMTKYPLGSNITIWYWDEDPTYITQSDPTTNIPFLWYFLSTFAFFVLCLVAHSVSVMFFGFDSLTGNRCSCRIKDPYKV